MVGMRDDDDLLVESGEWLLSSRFRCSNFEFFLLADMSGAGAAVVDG